MNNALFVQTMIMMIQIFQKVFISISVFSISCRLFLMYIQICSFQAMMPCKDILGPRVPKTSLSEFFQDSFVEEKTCIVSIILKKTFKFDDNSTGRRPGVFDFVVFLWKCKKNYPLLVSSSRRPLSS